MSSRQFLIRDEPKISLWAHGDTLQGAGWVGDDHGLGSGRPSPVRQWMFQACTRYECCAGRTIITLLHHCTSLAEIVSRRSASARAFSRDREIFHRSPRSACLVSCPPRGARRARPWPVRTRAYHLKWLELVGAWSVPHFRQCRPAKAGWLVPYSTHSAGLEAPAWYYTLYRSFGFPSFSEVLGLCQLGRPRSGRVRPWRSGDCKSSFPDSFEPERIRATQCEGV